jgi:hypothetical protein
MVYQIYDNVIALIRHKGNRLDELRLRRALGQPFTQAEAESVLAPYRFLDRQASHPLAGASLG